MTWADAASALIIAVATLLGALPGLIKVMRSQRATIDTQQETIARQEQTISGVAEALRILEGNGNGRVDEMLELSLRELAEIRARQERMDERDNVTDQRLGRLEARVDGISRHQRKDRESLDTIQTTVASLKDAASKTVERIAALEEEQHVNIGAMAITELARVVPVRDEPPPTVDDVDEAPPAAESGG